MKQRTARKLLGVLLALAMVAGLVPGMLLTALADGEAQSVKYVDGNGKYMGAKDCLPVAETMTTGWYVSRTVTFENRIQVKGNVNLILKDGTTFDAKAGIHVPTGSSLTIWAQSTGGSMGKLNAVNKITNDVSYSCRAGIGGDYFLIGGDITINGGKIYASGSQFDFDALREGGSGIYCNVVTINGGDITATGKGRIYDSGAGIAGNEIIINGGTVNATGGTEGAAGIGDNYVTHGGTNEELRTNITINGGDVTATGGLVGGAGIGGCTTSAFNRTITITGGKVTANGRMRSAGIGSGDGQMSGTITISGGNVTATGGSDGSYGGPGIGGGNSGNLTGTITISGADTVVTATGGNASAGIGTGKGGNAKDGHIHIEGGTVIARAGKGGAGIGAGEEGFAESGGEGCNDVRITGGTVFAQSGEGRCSAIGHGENDRDYGNITFANGMCVKADTRTTGDIDGAYERDGKPFLWKSDGQEDGRMSACQYRHTALIQPCTHPMTAGENDGFTHIDATAHLRAVCVYCKQPMSGEPHTFGADGKCTICGYARTICAVSFDPNGGSGTMGVMHAVPGRQVTLPPCGFTPPAGATFVGWDVNGETVEADKPAKITEDITVKALWSEGYPLWVGDIRVTSANAGDILGDGTAKYTGDDSTGTLTLDGAVITEGHVYDRANGLSAGITSQLDGELRIVVQGETSVNVKGACGIQSTGALAISGGERLTVRGGQAVSCGGNLTIQSADVTAVANGSGDGITAGGNLVISDSTVAAAGKDRGLGAAQVTVSGADTVVNARATQSKGCAITASGGIVLNDGLGVVTPVGGGISAGKTLGKDGKPARETVISRLALYDVWVGQTQVTSDNYRNVLGDSNVSYDPDTHTLTFAAAAPTINGIHGSAMVYAGHDLTVVAPEGGLTLENAAASHGIDAAGDLTLRGDVTVNVMNQAIYTEENFTAHGNLTARGMGAALTTGGLIEANGSVTVEGDLNGYNKTGYGLRAGGDLAVDGSVKLNAATGSAVSAGGSVNIAGSLDNTLFDGQALVSTNGLRADGDIYVGGDVSLLASDTGIRSESGSINVLSGRWEVNNGTHGTVAMDAVRINIPDTHEITEPAGGAVKTYTEGDETRESISSEGNTAAYAVIDRKSDAPTDAPAVPTVQLTPESAALSYGGAEDENRILAAAATVEPETSLGTLTYRWQRQEADGYWQTVASGVNMTEYAVPTDAAVGTYTYRCLVVNALNGASVQAESNDVTVIVGKAAPVITEPRVFSLTYSGRPQRLAMDGSANGGTMQYSLDGESWSGSVPTATNAGTYTLYYRVQGDGNHSDLAAEQLEASIAKRRLVITVESKEKMVGEADPALTYLAEGLAQGDMLQGQLTREAGEEVGTYFISAEAIQPADYCKANYTVVGQGSVLTILAREFGTPDFTMPAELAEIMESAFEGLGEMKVVDAHGCAAIGRDAFKDTGLVRIRLPKDCEIDAEAFGDQKIYVFAPAGGTTEAYCAGHDNLVFIAE